MNIHIAVLLCAHNAIAICQLDAMGLAIAPPSQFELVIEDDGRGAGDSDRRSVDALFRVRAKWAFDGMGRSSGAATHLAFVKGEELDIVGRLEGDDVRLSLRSAHRRITLTHACNAQAWLVARNASGLRGTIPANRVERIEGSER